MKNQKLKAILSATGYFLLILALCFSGALIFHSYYYESIYVSGSSMSPTLNGSDYEQSGSIVDIGIVDNHRSAINHIERFDIITTYYPEDYTYSGELLSNAKKKIKRVIALPGETFKITYGILEVLGENGFEEIDYPFKTQPAVETSYIGKDTIFDITLGEDEYWVLGDNRENSRDCGTTGIPITKDNIYGVLVAIEGTGELYVKRYICEDCGKEYSGGNGMICPECGGSVVADFAIKNKHYHWPKYY